MSNIDDEDDSVEALVFEIPELEFFMLKLPPDEKEIFYALVDLAKKHQFISSKMAKPLTFHTFVLCGMMELMKEIKRLNIAVLS
ncbi:MAG: hypothetical protein FVQ83_14850 [Chloroflexi bacterium]|nr:hypothetical protein [Chloroflexota bacterium]